MTPTPEQSKTLKAAPKPANLSDIFFERELRQFVGKPVTVDYEMLATGGPVQPSNVSYKRELRTVTGTLRAYQRQSVMCIVDTPTESVFIRYPLEIRRARKSANASDPANSGAPEAK
jgi:hypothetical protein